MVKHKLATLVAAALFSVAALPALADSVSFGFSVGDHGRHHGGYHRGYHHGYHRGYGWGHPAYFSYHHYSRPYYYDPYPVVYYSQPTVIQRNVVYEEPVLQGTPGRVISNSPYCREYTRSVNVGGHLEQSYGTACRQPDGAWKIVSE